VYVVDAVKDCGDRADSSTMSEGVLTMTTLVAAARDRQSCGQDHPEGVMLSSGDSGKVLLIRPLG
jgi:hypothetical protein